MRYEEQRIISVTPVAKGLLLPALALVTTTVAVQYGSAHVHLIRSLHTVLLVVLVVPCIVVLVTRVWRWRSHKVHVTNQRIVVEGGVLHHRRSDVEIRDIAATHIDQRVRERLMRRGMVILETRSGTMNLGVVHHPSALCRLIDNERLVLRGDEVAFDTVFDFDAPQSRDFEISPRRRRERH